jgi:hypothetical protein
MEPDRRNQRIAGGIWALFVVLPAMLAGGVFPGISWLPAPVWLLITAAGGAAGTVVVTGRRRAVSAVLGAIGGAGCLFTIPLYVALRSHISDHFFSLELLLPAGVVALPLLVVWRVIDRRPVAAKPAISSELQLAATRTQEAPDRSLCARHPQTVARWACGRCGAFFCPLCARYPVANGKPVCEACAPNA